MHKGRDRPWRPRVRAPKVKAPGSSRDRPFPPLSLQMASLKPRDDQRCAQYHTAVGKINTGTLWSLKGFPVAQLVESPPATQETWVPPLGWEDPLEKERLPTPVFWPGESHGLCGSWGCRAGHD